VKIELIKPWLGKDAGTVVDYPGGVADVLFRRRIAIPAGQASAVGLPGPAPPDPPVSAAAKGKGKRAR
jgi:hypothetical protein